MTDFSSICDILGEVLSQHDEEPGLKDFISFHDLGLPLAYMQMQDLATPSEAGIKYIMNTWKLFLDFMNLEDTGFTDLDSILDA
jgi:hypothetical protein